MGAIRGRTPRLPSNGGKALIDVPETRAGVGQAGGDELRVLSLVTLSDYPCPHEELSQPPDWTLDQIASMMMHILIPFVFSKYAYWADGGIKINNGAETVRVVRSDWTVKMDRKGAGFSYTRDLIIQASLGPPTEILYLE